jgi:hypothetical protein
MNAGFVKFPWHTNCDSFGRIRFMAAKLKMMKFLQEARALADITNRRPLPRSPMLYLIQLRSQGHEITVPKRRLVVSGDNSEAAQTPQPVTINFAKPAEATCADVMGV